ncbi:unnamed protein product, partial [marine sediment metagenome]
FAGLRVLYDFFEEWQESTGQEVELDVIAICCEWSELTISDIQEQYDLDTWSVSDYLDYHTMIAGKTDTTIVFQDF